MRLHSKQPLQTSPSRAPGSLRSRFAKELRSIEQHYKQTWRCPTRCPSNGVLKWCFVRFARTCSVSGGVNPKRERRNDASPSRMRSSWRSNQLASAYGQNQAGLSRLSPKELLAHAFVANCFLPSAPRIATASISFHPGKFCVSRTIRIRRLVTGLSSLIFEIPIADPAPVGSLPCQTVFVPPFAFTVSI